MAALIFVSIFVALGLGVVLVAMRGGPRGVRDTLERGRTQRLHVARVRGRRRRSCCSASSCRRSSCSATRPSAGPGGEKLSADLKEGRELFTQRCATCHTLDDANAVGRVGPDLDVLAPTAGPDARRDRGGPRARARARCPPSCSTAKRPSTWPSTSPKSPGAERRRPARRSPRRRRPRAVGARARTRKLRDSVRSLHNTAHMQGNRALLRCRRQHAESGLGRAAGAGEPFVGANRQMLGVAQLFQREPVSSPRRPPRKEGKTTWDTQRPQPGGPTSEHLRDVYERTDEARRRADLADLAQRRAPRRRAEPLADAVRVGVGRRPPRPRRARVRRGRPASPRRGPHAKGTAVPARRTVEIRGRTVPAPAVPRIELDRRRPAAARRSSGRPAPGPARAVGAAHGAHADPRRRRHRRRVGPRALSAARRATAPRAAPTALARAPRCRACTRAFFATSTHPPEPAFSRVRRTGRARPCAGGRAAYTYDK